MTARDSDVCAGYKTRNLGVVVSISSDFFGTTHSPSPVPISAHIFDGNASLPNILTCGTLKYGYGLGLLYAVDDSGNVQVDHTDGRGSARALTDGSGSLIETYLTDPFGVPTTTQGTSTQPFQFTGQQQDPTGLYYLRARMYDPLLGRFLGRDTLFGSIARPPSLNRYAYAENNPVNRADPSGLSSDTGSNLNDPSPGISDPTSPPDTQCLTTLGGLLKFYGVNAACLDMPAGVTGFTTVQVGPARVKVAAVFFAKTGDGTGNNKDVARSQARQMGLPGVQLAGVLKAIRRAGSTDIITIVREAGGAVIVRAQRAGANGYQVIEAVVKTDGTKVVTQYAYDAAGNLVHVHLKTP